MMKQPTLILCFLALAAVAARADDCGSQRTQTGMSMCAGEAFKTADAELNARYRRIVACLKDEAAPLVEAQRAWIRFRDEECKFQGSASAGGSIQPFVIAECLESVTMRRSKELDYYLTCAEGDASCPTFKCGFKVGAPDK